MPDFFSSFAYHFQTLPNKSQIAYLDEGPKNAPVILFLHGLSDNAHIWDLTISALKSNFRCIALDLPGHGKSNFQSFRFKMLEYADAISEFIKEMNINIFKLVGHSMGGQISIILSLRTPALIEKLVLVAPAGFEQFTESEKKLIKLGASYSNGWQVGNTISDTSRQTTMQQSLAGMLSEPVFDFLPQLQVPTLVIFGEQDTLIPNRYLHRQSTATIARTGTSRIPNAELQIFPRCGHYPQTEQATNFNATVLGFLK